MGLQSFERGLEKMVDGIFSRAFKTGVRPVELGRRMMREMDEHRSVDVHGRRIVPNQFAFFLSPADLTTFSGVADALEMELIESAHDYAAQEGYYFMGPVTVDFVERSTMRTGRFHVVSQMNADAVPSRASQPVDEFGDPIDPSDELSPSNPVVYHDPAGHAEDLSPWAPTGSGPRSPSPSQTAAPAPTRYCLVLSETAERIPLGNEPAVIGRLANCRVVVSDLNVSRRHAEVRRNGGVYVVADLGSTNGTLVNGIRIEGERLLHPGDVISVGATRLRFETT